MAEFEEKLNSILGNQEAMGQIMALARSLSGGESSEGTAAESQASPSTPPNGGVRRNEPESPLPDLSAMLGQIDPGILKMGMGLLQEYQGDDDRNAALLAALRPFLKEDRRVKLDRALQIVRVTRLIRVALGAMGGKGDEGRV